MMDRLVISSFWVAFLLFFAVTTYQLEELRSFDVVARPSTEVTVSRTPATAASGVVQSNTPASWARAILDKPLFSVTRRPFVNEVRFVPPQAPRLSGIIISPHARLAIFAPEAGQQVIRQEGEHMDSFAIRQILPAKVVLVGAQGNVVLEPQFAAATPAPIDAFRMNRGTVFGAMPLPDAANRLRGMSLPPH
jgi:hypothetical protein